MNYNTVLFLCVLLGGSLVKASDSGIPQVFEAATEQMYGHNELEEVKRFITASVQEGVKKALEKSKSKNTVSAPAVSNQPVPLVINVGPTSSSNDKKTEDKKTEDNFWKNVKQNAFKGLESYAVFGVRWSVLFGTSYVVMLSLVKSGIWKSFWYRYGELMAPFIVEAAKELGKGLVVGSGGVLCSLFNGYGMFGLCDAFAKENTCK